MRNEFCCLCGVLLEPLPDNAVIPPEEPLPWAQEVRAVRSDRGRSSVVFTGVGFIEELHLLASSDPTVSYLEFADTASLDAHALRSTSDDEWIFNFHSACWDLLLDRVLGSQSTDRSDEVARHLFDLLYCLPFDRHRTPVFGHDFGGALRFRDVLGPPPIQKYISLGCAFMLFDPLEADAFATSSLATLPVPDIFSTAATPYVGAGAPGDIFARFPNELALLMLSHLASADVSNLRLSSRTIAHISHPAQLPQSFWESRFTGDFEMGFFFSGSVWPERRSDVDWRSLYGRLKMADGARLTPHLRNRRRIWTNLSHFVGPLRFLLGKEPQAAAESDLREPFIPSGYWPGPEARSENLSTERLESTEGIHAGVRVFEKFGLLFPSMSRAEHVKIGVSLLPFDGEEYVCGLRVGAPRDFASAGTTSQVGIIRSSTEREFWLSYGDHVGSIDVATTISGIVGLRFHVQKATGSRVDFTAGSFDQSTTKIGIASLIAPGDGAVDGVIVGLDAFKFVSIRLIEPQSTLSSVPDGASVQNLKKDILTSMATLWNPKCPLQHGTVRLPASHIDKQKNSSSDGSSFCLNIDFGGCAGAKLPLLNRITATLDRSPGLFKGFGFSYDDGTEEFFGTRSAFQNASSRRSCVEMSFPVSGRDGELVTEIGVRTRSSGSNARVGAIVAWERTLTKVPWKITTNLGNSTSFEYQSVESSALPLSNSMQIHRAPEGQVITGFLAKVKHSCGSVQSLGFQSQVPDTPPCKSVTPLRRQPHSRQWQHMFPVLGGRFELAGHMLRYPGSCVTTVRLGGIKRIRISSGAAGRSRASEEISGLCFEFWDSDRPVIVGQWIEEITTVELKRGDRITGMSIWLSQTHDLRRAASMPTENNGRVVGINISTAAGIGKEARFGTNDAALLRLDFNENPFQRLCGIVWSFNYKWDYLQILSEADPSHHGTSLIHHHVPRNRQFSENPQKFFWEDGNGRGLASLSSVDAVWSGNGLAGLVFHYNSAYTRSVGQTRGTKTSFHLQEGEGIVRLDVGWRHGVLVALEFRTSQGRTSVLHTAAYDPSHEDGTHFHVYPLEQGAAAEAASGSAEMVEPFRDVTLPPADASRCVGIWVMLVTWPRAMNRVKYMGPLFLADKALDLREE